METEKQKRRIQKRRIFFTEKQPCFGSKNRFFSPFFETSVCEDFCCSRRGENGEIEEKNKEKSKKKKKQKNFRKRKLCFGSKNRFLFCFLVGNYLFGEFLLQPTQKMEKEEKKKKDIFLDRSSRIKNRVFREVSLYGRRKLERKRRKNEEIQKRRKVSERNFTSQAGDVLVRISATDGKMEKEGER